MQQTLKRKAIVLNEALPEVKLYFEGRHADAYRQTRGQRPTLKHWLTQFGILTGTVWGDAKYMDEGAGLHYGWERTGAGQAPGRIITVWTEVVHTDPDGIWYLWDPLTPEVNEDGKERDAGQQERMRERARMLRACFETKEPFDALLLENKKSQAELRAAKKPASAISQSVRDEQQWHVLSWDEAQQRALLVRGPAARPGWRPPGEGGAPAVPGEPHLVFPDQAHRDLVEEAAVAAVQEEFKRYRIESRERDNLGFDLELFSKATDLPVYRFEVKGTAGAEQHFFITRNERRRASTDELWRLVIVTNALSDAPVVGQPLRWAEAVDNFDLEPLVWHATLKDSSL